MKRTGFVATLLFAAACGSDHASAPATSPAPAHTTLASQALRNDHFARRTLYTWTTAGQIEDLRRGGPLLVAEVSEIHGSSTLEATLSDLAERADPMARLLYTTTFAKMRFGWHAPWATRLGWPDEQYGDELIRVTLKPDAFIVGLTRTSGQFSAHDLADRDVPLADVIAHPERIAAIFFVNDFGSTNYREFALCNESMIESWEYGTDAIRQELADEANELDALAARTGAQTLASAPHAWDHATSGIADEYQAALAFGFNPLYSLDAAGLRGLAQTLRSSPRRFVAHGECCARFPGIGKARPPAIVRRRSTTYTGTYYGTHKR